MAILNKVTLFQQRKCDVGGLKGNVARSHATVATSLTPSVNDGCFGYRGSIGGTGVFFRMKSLGQGFSNG